jgi:hypothetical protein
MPEVLYVAERRTSTFQTDRVAADVVCASDSPRIIIDLDGMVRAARDAVRQAIVLVG